MILDIDETSYMRWGAIILAAAAVILYAFSFYEPYWKFTLLAPQYPDGLTLHIFLDHLTGDVREIDGLNHYIGMESLEKAATFEKSIAHWAVGGLAALVLAGGLFVNRFLNKIAALGAILFPVGFLLDSFYWLYTFGNNLDPRAPINLDPFTPTLIGEGTVGQFRTIAGPELGFWLATIAALLAVGSWWLNRRYRLSEAAGVPAEAGPERGGEAPQSLAAQ